MERHEWIEDAGTLEFPEDFAERLGRLEELSGLSLEEFARQAGLSESRARAWRDGAEPDAEEVWALAHWADGLPGGWDVLAERLLSPGGMPTVASGADAPGPEPDRRGASDAGAMAPFPFMSELEAAPASPIHGNEPEALERHERIDDFEGPPFPHQLDAWMARMDRLEFESPEEFAAELRRYEERMEEWAPDRLYGGMCSWMRLTAAASEARAARSSGDAEA